MTYEPMEMEAFEKTATGDGSFEQAQETLILKWMGIMYKIISIICFPCSIVIVDMLNIFIKDKTILKQR